MAKEIPSNGENFPARPNIEPRGRLKRASDYVGRNYGALYASLTGGASVTEFATGDVKSGVILGAVSAGIALLESGTRSFNKYRQKVGNDILAGKNLDGFTISANPTIDILEDRLGISFPEIPNKIVLDEENSRIYSRKRPFLSLLRRPNDEGSLHSRSTNAFLLNSETSYSVDLFQNMLSYVRQKNPEFTDMEQKLLRVDNERIPNDYTAAEAEKYVIYRSFHEGLAGVLAKGVNDLLLKEQVDEVFKSSDLDIFNGITLEGQHENMPLPEITDEQVQQMKDSITALQQSSAVEFTGAHGVHTYRNLRKRTFTLIKIKKSDDNLVMGALFSAHALNELTVNGIELPEAIDLLIEHPPQTQEELLSPQQFVTEKILGQ